MAWRVVAWRRAKKPHDEASIVKETKNPAINTYRIALFFNQFRFQLEIQTKKHLINAIPFTLTKADWSMSQFQLNNLQYSNTDIRSVDI